MEFTAVIKKGEKQFVALCPELDVVSQGYTVEEALDNLREAVELYIEEMVGKTLKITRYLICAGHSICRRA